MEEPFKTPMAAIHLIIPRCLLHSPDEILTVRIHVWFIEAYYLPGSHRTLEFLSWKGP